MNTKHNVTRVLCIALGIYAFGVRPRLLRWDAADDEVRRPYPGGKLIRGGTRGATMAITIDATLEDVWPWLVQMGYGRAGWYSWDRLDNFGERSAEQIHPEWQEIALGDFLGPQEGMTSRAWAVAALERGRFLGLRASFDLRHGRWFDPTGTPPPFFTDSLWGFLLEPLPDGNTRLVVSGYWALRPRWLQPIMSVLFLEPEHWIMQMRQFRNLKRLTEGSAPVTSGASSVDQPMSASIAAN